MTDGIRKTLVFVSFLVTIASLLLPAMPAQAALTDVPAPWSSFVWQPYLYNGEPIYDTQSSGDGSHGGTGVSPSDIDISSCAPDGSASGLVPSVWRAFHDIDGDPETLHDAFIAFRLRLGGSPIESSGQKAGYSSRHWNILIDMDGDGYKEFVIDIDGTFASSKADRVFLYYNDANTQAINPATDKLDEWYAAEAGSDHYALSHTRAVEDTTISCNGTYEWWLDVQIPLSAFNVGGTQKISPDTPIRVFYSTSTSNTNPLQKDWMMNAMFPEATSFSITDPIIFGDPVQPDPLVPMWVALAAFEARPGAGGVQVVWETGSEMDNLGFHLYRATSVDGPSTRLNAELIPSQALGNMVGASYAWLDETATPGQTYYYWLEDLDLSGSSQRHGPVSVLPVMWRQSAASGEITLSDGAMRYTPGVWKGNR